MPRNRNGIDSKLMIYSILVHLVLFYSIFDVYFKSPLSHGMQPVELTNIKAPAKRLALFVADGLRLDTFSDLVKTNQIKFLASAIDKGASGISNTRVPTESRPGHVAMIAGFYEDISAVAKGWKENPIEFDSVFNRSTYCLSWGSPDILTMFKKNSPHVHTFSYDSADEDFAASDASHLDTWVLNNFIDFMYNARKNETTVKMLNSDKIVFFFHLLGIDTNGHSKKPHSKEYKNNVIIVDDVIAKITKSIEQYYSYDNQTAYIFTSDHGMTDWGSHGSGLDTERLIPFVAWGSGVAKISTVNIEQADTAPLMSYLIGVPIPLNSIGKLPLSVLNFPDNIDKAIAFKHNVLQIVEQVKIKYETLKANTFFFKEYSNLKMSSIVAFLNSIDEHISSGFYDMAIQNSNRLIDESLQAIDYYNKYFTFYLGTCIFLTYVFWIVYLLIRERNVSCQNKIKLNVSFFFLSIFIWLYSFCQSFPITYYVYSILPVIILHQIILKWQAAVELLKSFKSNKLEIFCLFIGIELILISFFYRFCLSVILGFYSMLSFAKFYKTNSMQKWLIMLSPLLLSIFPMLPVISGHLKIHLVYISFLLTNIAFFLILFKIGHLLRISKSTSIIIVSV
jgi:phosphatidylinositol glycan class N